MFTMDSFCHNFTVNLCFQTLLVQSGGSLIDWLLGFLSWHTYLLLMSQCTEVSVIRITVIITDKNYEKKKDQVVIKGNFPFDSLCSLTLRWYASLASPCWHTCILLWVMDSKESVKDMKHKNTVTIQKRLKVALTEFLSRLQKQLYFLFLSFSNTLTIDEELNKLQQAEKKHHFSHRNTTLASARAGRGFQCRAEDDATVVLFLSEWCDA